MTGSVCTSAFSDSARSELASQTPTLVRFDNVTCCACHTANGTMTLESGTPITSACSSSDSRNMAQSSLTIWPFLIISDIGILTLLYFCCLDLNRGCIHKFFKWIHTDALH